MAVLSHPSHRCSPAVHVQAGRRFNRCTRFVGRAAQGAQLENPYDVLELQRGADLALVRKAFRVKASKFHPDVVGTGNIRSFQRVLLAYQRLSASSEEERRSWSQEVLRNFANEVQEVNPNVLPNAFGAVHEQALEALIRNVPDTDPMWGLLNQTKQQWIDESRRQEEEAVNVEPDPNEAMYRRRELIKGVYEKQGVHSGKPAYRKVAPAPVQDVLVYFCEGSGGALRGWCVGPVLGSSAGVAYNSDPNSDLPPLDGWVVLTMVGSTIISNDCLTLTHPVDNFIKIAFCPATVPVDESVLPVVKRRRRRRPEADSLF